MEMIWTFCACLINQTLWPRKSNLTRVIFKKNPHWRTKDSLMIVTQMLLTSILFIVGAGGLLCLRARKPF